MARPGQTPRPLPPNSIRTVSGRYIDILTLDPGTIHIEDIAHGLAHMPRFGGQLPVFYSVAQHSINVFNLVRQNTDDRSILLQALLHDASEFLIGDMPSPIKQHLPDYQALEARIMQVISTKYQFPWPMLSPVKAADRAMLEAEWKHIMLIQEGGVLILPIYEPSGGVAKGIARKFLEIFHEYAPAQ